MKQFLILILVLLSLIGCKRDPVPKDAIEKETFVNILVDIHIAESIYKDRLRLKMDSLNSLKLYNSVLERYNVSKEQVLLTSVYYSRHQREYDKIYAEVLDRINVMIEENNEARSKAPEKETERALTDERKYKEFQ